MQGGVMYSFFRARVESKKQSLLGAYVAKNYHPSALRHCHAQVQMDQEAGFVKMKRFTSLSTGKALPSCDKS
jgi:hypothetical protein